MKIHPTAIVEDGARLGAGVEVGAYALVGPDVVIGDGCRILAHAVLTGHTTLGKGNVVGQGAVLGAAPQDFAHDESMISELRIGDGNTIREYATIHRATGAGSATVIGDGNFLMAGVHVGHNARIGSRTVIANNCLLAGHVEIGDAAVLGGGTVFHQHMRIGRLAMVRGGTRFGKDIPPFVVADGENRISGLNVVGLRRAGLPQSERLELKRLFKALFRSGRNLSQAIEAAEREPWSDIAREMMVFIRAAKKRGVCVANRSKAARQEEED